MDEAQAQQKRENRYATVQLITGIPICVLLMVTPLFDDEAPIFLPIAGGLALVALVALFYLQKRSHRDR